jgi:hypothetical protein
MRNASRSGLSRTGACCGRQPTGLPQGRGELRLVPDSEAETLVLFHENGRGQPDVIPAGAPVGLTGLLSV